MNDLMTKSFLNYVDLKKAAAKDAESDLEMGMAAASAQSLATLDPKMEEFLEEAEKVKSEMGIIRDILVRIESTHEQSKCIHKPDSIKELRTKMNSDIVAVLRKARMIKSRLEEMDQASVESRRLSQKLGTPIDRTRIGVINGLRKKLKEIMVDFQALRERMKLEYKETVGRCYYTVTGEYPGEEQLDELVSQSEGATAILSRAIQEHGRGKVVETVVEIQDRHDAAKEIERSLLELHQVFMDMAVMVEAQGEQMDNIEHHVMNASHYVKDGTKELKTAKEYQKGSRKWMCLGIVLFLLIVIIILGPIIASFS